MMFCQISFENKITEKYKNRSHVAFILEDVGLSCCGIVTIYSNKTESSTN